MPVLVHDPALHGDADDGEGEEGDAGRAAVVEHRVLNHNLEEVVEHHLEAAEHIGLAGADPPRKEIEIFIVRVEKQLLAIQGQ